MVERFHSRLPLHQMTRNCIILRPKLLQKTMPLPQESKANGNHFQLLTQAQLVRLRMTHLVLGIARMRRNRRIELVVKRLGWMTQSDSRKQQLRQWLITLLNLHANRSQLKQVSDFQATLEGRAQSAMSSLLTFEHSLTAAIRRWNEGQDCRGKVEREVEQEWRLETDFQDIQFVKLLFKFP